VRIGVMVGPERGRYSTKIDRLLADAQWAEDAGLASLWVPQIPDDFDALTAATLIAVRTNRIEIRTAVVPVQPRAKDVRVVSTRRGKARFSHLHWPSYRGPVRAVRGN